MKKKLLSIVLVAVMAASVLTGCGSKEETYNIGICQLVEHPALDAATQGFQDALNEKLGDKVNFSVQNAQGEQTTATTICNGFVSEGVDLILDNRLSSIIQQRGLNFDDLF